MNLPKCPKCYMTGTYILIGVYTIPFRHVRVQCNSCRHVFEFASGDELIEHPVQNGNCAVIDLGSKKENKHG
jgi:hypothetical protein